ncbi:MAG: hypothetical protein ACM3PZ_03380 [Bacillota bacterium]
MFKNALEKVGIISKKEQSSLEDELIAESQGIIAAREKYRKKQRGENPSQDSLRRARINLLVNGKDDKFSGLGGERDDYEKGQRIFSYLLDYNDKFTSEDISLLLGTEFRPYILEFLSLNPWKHQDYTEEVLLPLLDHLNQKGETEAITNMLHIALDDKQKGSYALFRKMIDYGQAFMVRQNLNIFEDSISPKDLSEIAYHDGPSYPFHAGDLFQAIERTPWSQEDKLEAEERVSDGQFVIWEDLEYAGDKLADKWKKAALKMPRNEYGDDFEPSLMKMVRENGFSLTNQYRSALSGISAKGMEELMAEAEIRNQEHLLISLANDELPKQFISGYLWKLIAKGERQVLSEMSEKYLFQDVADKQLFLAARQLGCILDLDKLCAPVDEEMMTLLEGDRALPEYQLFRNATKIEVAEGKWAEYAKKVKAATELFNWSEKDAYTALIEEVVKTQTLDEFLETIQEKKEIVKNIPEEALMSYGWDILGNTKEDLSKLVVEVERFVSCLPGMANFGRMVGEDMVGLKDEEKERFYTKLQAAKELFGGDQDALTGFLNVNVKKVSYNPNISKIIRQYGDLYKDADPLKQEILESIVPGIESLMALKDSFPDDHDFEVNISDFINRTSGWADKKSLERACKFAGNFGYMARCQELYRAFDLLDNRPEPDGKMLAAFRSRFGLPPVQGESWDELLVRAKAVFGRSDLMQKNVQPLELLGSRYGKCLAEGLSEKDRIAVKILEGELRSADPDFRQMQLRDDSPWAVKLAWYIEAADGGYLPEEGKEKALKMFDETKTKNEALSGMRESWKNSLSGEHRLEDKLHVLSSLIYHIGGAGNLKHVESIANLAYTMEKYCWNNAYTVPRTKDETEALLLAQEERFDREKWSQDARSNFYNLSADIIQAAPSLFSAFQPVFDRLDPRMMKDFAKDIFPLYQAWLVSLQKSRDDNSETSYDAKDLIALRDSLYGLGARMELYPEDKGETLAEAKQEMLSEVKGRFKERFGLADIPDNIDKKSIRSISNCVRYLGNISKHGEKNDSLISLYLSLKLKGKWEDFRAGSITDLSPYLTPQRISILEAAMKGKRENNIAPELIGLAEEEAMAFQKSLQAETISTMVGTVQTIDLRLENLKRNISDLADPDAFPDVRDRALIEMSEKAGSRGLNSLLAKIYGATKGKEISFNEEEMKMKEQLAEGLGIKEWNGEAVKSVQDRLQPISLIRSLLDKFETEKTDEKIGELQSSLIPGEDIASIFNRLDEEFRPSSGAYALFKDLEYLENLTEKSADKLSSDEKDKVESYLGAIRGKMIVLEGIMSKVKEAFIKLGDVAKKGGNELINNRVKGISEIMQSAESSLIQTTMTCDLDLIIENMRQCLGCLRKEQNNDTNLSFGDYNKFFIMSRQGKDEGSVSDQIAYFFPVKYENGKKEMDMILDRIYGSKSSDLLLSHCLAAHKKMKGLKESFKGAGISLVVSDAALQSSGISAEQFVARLKEKGIDTAITTGEKMGVDVPASPFGDHYLEFTDKAARFAGQAEFSGVRISY